jgi:hypothetical protein
MFLICVWTGNGIILSGKTGAVYGPFSAQVDNGEARQLSALSGQPHSAVLFRQDNLQDGDHELTVTNHGGGLLNRFCIDSATPIVWSPLSPAPGPAPTPPQHKVNSGLIAGAVIGALAGFVVLLCLLGCASRRKRERMARRAASEKNEEAAYESTLISTPPFALPSLPPSPHSYDSHQSLHSYAYPQSPRPHAHHQSPRSRAYPQSHMSQEHNYYHISRTPSQRSDRTPTVVTVY